MSHVVVADERGPDPEALAVLARLGVSTVHEAQDRTGLLDCALRPILAGSRIAGRAVTVSSHPGDNLMLHAAVEQVRPGDIVVVATTSPSTDGMLGDLLATSLRAHGAVGVVTDAGVRDVAELREMGFPVWARAVSARGTVKATPGSVNVPVVVAGQLVRPGDAIVADDDGVCVVERQDVPVIAARATERHRNEEEKRTRLAAGVLGLDMYDLRPLLERLGVEYVKHD